MSPLITAKRAGRDELRLDQLCLYLILPMFDVVRTRRRKLHGPQEGPTDKTFQDRELERQAFQREINASKQSTRSGVSVF